MRTTIYLPDPLFRHAKALAAARGVSLRDLVICAVERELNTQTLLGVGSNPLRRRVHLPLIRLRSKRKLDLSGFDFDNLLA